MFIPEVHVSCNGKLTQVVMENVTLWFSYKTLVAFHFVGQPLRVHENDWGKVTGRHLTVIDGGKKESRMSDDAFKLAWQSDETFNLSPSLQG